MPKANLRVAISAQTVGTDRTPTVFALLATGVFKPETLTWRVDYGDGTPAEGGRAPLPATASHQYASGTYAATLTVSAWKDSASASVTVTVQPEITPPPPPPPPPPSGDAHAYFNALVARPDHWKSYSLRDDAQLLAYRHNKSLQPSLTYDPVMDAAKASIPEYQTQIQAVLATGIDANATTLDITLTGTGGVFNVKGRFIKIGDEVMRLDALTPHPTDTTINVVRGQRGTTATSHAGDEGIHVGTQSIENQLRVPLGTEDGHRYFFVWDSYWPDEYRLPISAVDGYKMNQFESGGGIWFEPRIRINGGWGACANPAFDPNAHIGVLDFRGYNQLNGPEVWDVAYQNYFGPIVFGSKAPIEPVAGTFIVWPGRWTRHFVLIDQRANDYDYATCWAADEQQEPVVLLRDIPLSVRVVGSNPNSIWQWYIEINTSQDIFTHGAYERRIGLTMQSWWRNFAALIDPVDVDALLLRPVR